METLLNELAALVREKKLDLLTTDAAIELKGKRIQTIYFGYRGQDGADDFVIGDIKEVDWIQGYEPRIKKLYTAEGRDTFLYNHFLFDNGNIFSCTDVDRFVFYRVVE